MLRTAAAAVSFRPHAGTVPDRGRSGTVLTEGGRWWVLAATPAGNWTGRVDQLRQACRKVRPLLCRLIGGDRAGLLSGVDLRGGVRDERAHETVAALPGRRVCDLRERLARAELRFDVRPGHAEVRRGRGERVTSDARAATKAGTRI